MRLSKLPIEKILFLDLETVPEVSDWKELPDNMKELWEKKVEKQLGEGETTEDFYEKRAGILAEFGKIICISVGIVVNNKIKLTSYYGDDEKKILNDFSGLVNSRYFGEGLMLCAHNGKEFDFPYLGRRMLIHGIDLPNVLDIQGKKPWEIPHLDTMELWKFGDYKHYTSLNLLAAVFDIPSPKDDIDGSMVAKVYYEDHNLERIKIYCEKDVFTLIQVFRKFRNESLLERED